MAKQNGLSFIETQNKSFIQFNISYIVKFLAKNCNHDYDGMETYSIRHLKSVSRFMKECLDT